MPGQWEGSDRQSTLPKHWPSIRREVLDRDHLRCTWLLNHPDRDGGFADYRAGHHQHHKRCPHPATDVDHWGKAYDHRPINLRSLCEGHHNHRSSRQGNNARAALRRQLRGPTEPHPGLSP